MNPIRTSDTVVIKRSQIKFAPYNPKKHSEEMIKTQVKNFKSVGFLGGIVWNVTTGNLVSGHKRVMAMDKVFKNTEATPVDYELKVERVELSTKQEMEQNVFMDSRSTNTEQAYDLLAEIMPLIDPKEAGLDDIEISLIVAESPAFEFHGGEDAQKDLKQIEGNYEAKKQKVIDAKKKIKDEIFRSQGANYVTLSFDNYDSKAAFLDLMQFDSEATVVKGEILIERLNI